MSVSGISSSSFPEYSAQNIENSRQQIQQEFQQLGQDLQAGNLSAAQSDFANLQQLMPNNSNSTAQNNNPVTQAFNQLAQDLQAGNLSAAQQDYANLEQVFQNQAAQASQARGHHHHHGGGNGASAISQLFDQLGQALQSGDLSTAQQLFTTLQQDFQQFAQNSGQLQQPSQSSSATVSVNA